MGMTYGVLSMETPTLATVPAAKTSLAPSRSERSGCRRTRVRGVSEAGRCASSTRVSACWEVLISRHHNERWRRRLMAEKSGNHKAAQVKDIEDGTEDEGRYPVRSGGDHGCHGEDNKEGHHPLAPEPAGAGDAGDTEKDEDKRQLE